MVSYYYNGTDCPFCNDKHTMKMVLSIQESNNIKREVHQCVTCKKILGVLCP